ncbi:unnamed protein product [Spirodela intermedia]|uniref:Uncharacterized protein n=1 Tax=Spirodela intermedia TaxID=51605 RepID=A0A7I8KB60_SPIIN|nr:unnamed protein product [Spirodela intermedia]
MSMASKALLRQRQRGQSLDLFSKSRDQWNWSLTHLQRLSPDGAKKWQLCGSLAARKNNYFAALWRLSPNGEELDGGGAHVRELHLQVCVARGGSSSHLVCSQEVSHIGCVLISLHYHELIISGGHILS